MNYIYRSHGHQIWILFIIFFLNFYSHVQHTDLHLTIRSFKIFQIIFTTKCHKVFINIIIIHYMCKKEFKDVDILYWFFIYLFTHLTVLGNYKVFHEIQKMQKDYATYIFVICIYIINFIIVKHMFECLFFLKQNKYTKKTSLI